jgi:ketosteroid isomerase-like protein
VNATATPTDVEALVEAFDAKWRAGGPARAFVERFTPLLDPEVRLVQPQVPTLVGLDAFEKRFAEPLFALMPDACGAVRGWSERDGVVYIEVDVMGTIGDRRVKLRSCDRLTLRDGRIAQRVAFVDPSPLLRAVALTPRAWPTFIRTQLRQRRR